MSLLDAAGLLHEYDRWARDVMSKDVDSTPAAFLAHRRSTRALQMVTEYRDPAATAAESLREQIASWDASDELLPVLAEVLAVCDAVVEAGRWE